MLDAKALAHDVIETKFLSRKLVEELAKRWAFGRHAYCIAPSFTWRKGIIAIEIEMFVEAIRGPNFALGPSEATVSTGRDYLIGTEGPVIDGSLTFYGMKLKLGQRVKAEFTIIDD